ncbi:uncharacterized protein LOC109536299 [Dendroctonus ponderosae]
MSSARVDKSIKMSKEVDIKPPNHIVDDWSFNFQGAGKISSCFDSTNFNLDESYPVQVTHIYDPSHFWIVTRIAEIDAFHHYMHDFYKKYTRYYRIPLEHLKLNMYCMVHIDTRFYRGILTNVPLLGDAQTLGFVFLIDYGSTAKVPLDQLYFMTEAMFDVPAFAVRASLQGLGPLEGDSWPVDLADELWKLVTTDCLVGKVTYICSTNKVLFLKLFNLNDNNRESINDHFVSERLARQMSTFDVKEMKRSQKEKRLPVLPFLQPSFAELETGACTDSSKLAELIKEFQPFAKM